MKKRIISAVLVICMLLSCIITANAVTTEKNTSGATSTNSTGTNYNLADSVDDGVILQAWNWSYKNIEAKLEQLASLGYTTIQVSPPNTIKADTAGVKVYGSSDNAWWMFYQPAGFQLNQQANNALGTKDELASLVKKAHTYGMKVIADAVINHLGTNGDESASMLANKNTIDHVTPLAWTYAKDIMEANAFHEFFQMTYKEDANQYSRYDSTYDLTRGATSNLPDLDTSKPVVQNAILNYFKECIDIGIDGFRIDAAKHIETPDDISPLNSSFWDVVVGGANTYAKETQNKDMFYYGEILNSCGVGRPYSSYLKYFEITDSSTYYGLFNAVGYSTSGSASGNPSSYQGGYSNGMDASNAITWSESHDIYMDAVAANSIQSTNVINKRWALAAARDNTTMYFARPKNAYTTTLGDADDGAWNSTEVKAVNQFHNAMSGESEYISSSGNFAYNERGTTGVVIVNCKGNSANISLTMHKLENGTYTDQVSGNTFTCSNGKLTGSMGATGIVVLYQDDAAKVSSGTASGKYYTDSITLKLSAKNVDSATYEYNNGTPVAYENGQSVTIGSSADTKGATYVVTLKGYVDGKVACQDSYTYTKSEKASSYQVTFKPGSVWSGSTFNCYAWNNSSQSKMSDWPGTAMTSNGDGTYSYTISSDYDRVIFNTGENGKQTVDITLDDSSLFTLTGQTSTNSGGTTCYTVTTTSSGNTDPTYYPGQQEQTTESTSTSAKYSKGDVNRDGSVNISDATKIQRYLVLLDTLDNEQIALADFNSSGTVNIKDATAIRYYLVGLT
jgi:alpha-amylase